MGGHERKFLRESMIRVFKEAIERDWPEFDTSDMMEYEEPDLPNEIQEMISSVGSNLSAKKRRKRINEYGYEIDDGFVEDVDEYQGMVLDGDDDDCLCDCHKRYQCCI